MTINPGIPETPDPEAVEEVETPDDAELADFLEQVAADEGIGFDDDEEGEA